MMSKIIDEERVSHFDDAEIEALVSRRDTLAKKYPSRYPVFIFGAGWLTIEEAIRVLKVKP
jgi:hypothetical protein